MSEEKCKPENLKNLKKEENEMRTYDKDEKLEEINNGGKQSCGKGNSKNRMRFLYPRCIYIYPQPDDDTCNPIQH
ncbi:hypothetical protein Tco_0871672, partial [Tanacetum coccineum]